MSCREYKIANELVALVDNFEGLFYVYVPERFSQQWNGVLPQWFIMTNEERAHRKALSLVEHWKDYGRFQAKTETI